MKGIIILLFISHTDDGDNDHYIRRTYAADVMYTE